MQKWSYANAIELNVSKHLQSSSCAFPVVINVLHVLEEYGFGFVEKEFFKQANVIVETIKDIHNKIGLFRPQIECNEMSKSFSQICWKWEEATVTNTRVNEEQQLCWLGGK